VRDHLGITSAGVTTLIDRLVQREHVRQFGDGDEALEPAVRSDQLAGGESPWNGQPVLLRPLEVVPLLKARRPSASRESGREAPCRARRPDRRTGLAALACTRSSAISRKSSESRMSAASSTKAGASTSGFFPPSSSVVRIRFSSRLRRMPGVPSSSSSTASKDFTTFTCASTIVPRQYWEATLIKLSSCWSIRSVDSGGQDLLCDKSATDYCRLGRANTCQETVMKRTKLIRKSTQGRVFFSSQTLGLRLFCGWFRITAEQQRAPRSNTLRASRVKQSFGKWYRRASQEDSGFAQACESSGNSRLFEEYRSSGDRFS